MKLPSNYLDNYTVRCKKHSIYLKMILCELPVFQRTLTNYGGNRTF